MSTRATNAQQLSSKIQETTYTQTLNEVLNELTTSVQSWEAGNR